MAADEAEPDEGPEMGRGRRCAAPDIVLPRWLGLFQVRGGGDALEPLELVAASVRLGRLGLRRPLRSERIATGVRPQSHLLPRPFTHCAEGVRKRAQTNRCVGVLALVPHHIQHGVRALDRRDAPIRALGRLRLHLQHFPPPTSSRSSCRCSQGSSRSWRGAASSSPESATSPTRSGIFCGRAPAIRSLVAALASTVSAERPTQPAVAGLGGRRCSGNAQLWHWRATCWAGRR